jgi:site-specific recombinase XerC
MRAKRDYAMLALLFGWGFRRSELVGLELDEIQMRLGHWAVVDLIGKGGHIRTVPIPTWVKSALDQWTGRILTVVLRTNYGFRMQHFKDVIHSRDRSMGIRRHCFKLPLLQCSRGGSRSGPRRGPKMHVRSL